MYRKFLLMATAAIALNTAAKANDTDSICSFDLEEVVVNATRNPYQSTLSSETVGKNQLQEQNFGDNLPFLLSTTPSLVVTSDDGLGVGYTYFRIRGTDHTRINMTVNGVPLNDSESQTVFWVNMTDFASSLQNVQVQRGVGTSTNGSSAFGASVNMMTDVVSATPYATINFNGGMYNTFREMVKIGTGLMPSGFAFDARFSKVNSDGYLQRAFSNLYSYSFSGAYFGKKSMFKMLIFGGKEKTYMAWDGIDSATLSNNPRFNPAGMYFAGNDILFYDNQTDNYAQQNAQLHFAHFFDDSWNIATVLHYTHGNGYYEQYKRDKKFSSYGLPVFINSDNEEIKRSDLVNRKNLDNDFYGIVSSVNYKKNSLSVTLGGAVNNYSGDHFGNVIWVKDYPQAEKDFEYYRNRGKKFDGNVYLKANYTIFETLSLWADLQYRHVDYSISGINDEDLEEIPVSEKFNFFNPKTGISYQGKHHSAYFSFAVANREPSRKNYTEAGIHDIPMPERLYDYEFGYKYSVSKFHLGANLYYMKYKNQLVLTGKYSDTGATLTKNVKNSYRTGIEFIAGVEFTKWLRLDCNATLSQNKIRDYSDWVDDWNTGDQTEIFYGKTDISFSPNITAGGILGFSLKGITANFQTLFVGSQYLDNTMNKRAMLKDYVINNLILGYTLPFHKGVKNIIFKLQANNIFNVRYASNGGSYSYFDGADANGKFLPQNQKYTPWYFAQAGVNIHCGVIVEF
ncbi:MAG: TonB-dependent receptor [Prevotellaceae bacterium]|nr:TonB-dependent receptor [Prevotellaceae bacterium]